MIGRVLKEYMKSKYMMMSIIRNGGQECGKSYEVRNVEEKSGPATPCNRTVQLWQCRNSFLYLYLYFCICICNSQGVQHHVIEQYNCGRVGICICVICTM